MRKMPVMVVLACCIMLLSGCKQVAESAAKVAKNIKDGQEEVLEEEKKETEEKRSDISGDSDDAEQSEKSTGHPVIGQEDIEGYEGFDYLYDELLMTESEKNETTGKMESKKLTTYIPLDDYSSVNRGRAYVDSQGVYFEVEIQPYLQYKQDDYLMWENLQAYLEEEFDPFYRDSYKDLEISEIEKTGEHSVRATAKYCKYDQYSDDYYVIYSTYYLTELDNGITVLVAVEINADEISGKTEFLLKELEAFYEFNIDWDAEEAKQKKEDFLSGGGDNMVSTGFLLFELPEGWKEDRISGGYDNNVYAPGGDADFSGCAVIIERQYSESDDFEASYLLENEESIKEYLSELLGESSTELSISDYGTTCFGETVLVSFERMDSEEAGKYEYYFITERNYTYIVQAIQIKGALDDPFEVARNILKDGQVK